MPTNSANVSASARQGAKVADQIIQVRPKTPEQLSAILDQIRIGDAEAVGVLTDRLRDRMENAARKYGAAAVAAKNVKLQPWQKKQAVSLGKKWSLEKQELEKILNSIPTWASNREKTAMEIVSTKAQAAIDMIKSWMGVIKGNGTLLEAATAVMQSVFHAVRAWMEVAGRLYIH